MKAGFSRSLSLLLGLVFLCGFAASPAEAGCADPRNQSEMNHCAREAFKAADIDLNAAYKAAMTAMRATDAELPPGLRGAARALRNAQRAWIRFRDQNCTTQAFISRGGTMEPMLFSGCRARLTRARTAELKELAQQP